MINFAQNIITDFASQYGVDVSFIEEVGPKNERGESIQNTGEVKTVRCYPIEFNPSKKQREKAGVDEPVDVVAWMSYLLFVSSGLSDDITNTIMKIEGRVYKVKSFKKIDNFNGSDSLYAIFAGDKK